MARSREFDQQEVLERAMEVFWRQGYKATSLEDLLGAMDLSKSSFYQTFGSKHELLLEVLRHYVETAMKEFVAPLLREGASRAEIEETLCGLVERALTPEGRRGCLVNNCTVEVAPHDLAVEAHIRAGQQFLEDALYRAVRRGQQDGTISPGRDPRALARFLLNTLSGLNVLAKSNLGRQILEDVVRVALVALD